MSNPMTARYCGSEPGVSSTAATQTIDARGSRLAYRRFGVTGSLPPLLFTQRFRGTMDHWDPLLLDRIAARREVIVFDNHGVARSTGSPARSIAGQAQGAIDLIDALKIEEVDVLGWSMGGAVALAMALDFAQRVRRIVVAGSSPGGLSDAPPAPDKVWQVAGRPVNDDDDFLYLFFHDSASSQAAGRSHLRRLQGRAEPFSAPVIAETVLVQAGAIRAWGAGVDSALARLAEIRQPVLVANGQFDRMVHPYHSYVMSQRLPQAKLVLYPDAGHGFLFQHHDAFADEAARFLD
jgi:pimeloyl-ACP methyl ester carboxylesterase